MNPYELKDFHLHLPAYDTIQGENVQEALNVFLSSPDIQQMTFSFYDGAQAGLFLNIVQKFMKAEVYVYTKDDKSHAVDIRFVKEWEFMLKNYMIMKETNKVLVGFYVDEEFANLGHLTFIKGDKYHE